MKRTSLSYIGWALCLAMGVGAIGAAVGASQLRNDEPVVVKAAEGDKHTDTSVSFSQSLNNSATISNLEIATPSYTVAKISINVRYNKTAGGVTITPSIDGTALTPKTHNANSTVDLEWTVSPAVKGPIVFSFVNNCGSGTGKGTFYFNSVTLTEGAPAALVKPITEISSVTLSKTTVPVNYPKTITATASFAPADTDEVITWESADTSVATIEATSTNGVAEITIVGEGECFFVASNQDGTITADSDILTVTEAEVKRVYEITFAGTGTDSDGTTDLGTGVTGKMEGDGSAITASSGSKLYNGKNGTLKFSSKDVNGSMTISAGSDSIKSIVVEALGFGTDESSLSVKVGSNAAQSTGALDATKFKYFAFDFATAGTSITFTATKRLYLRNIALIVAGNTADQGVYNFAVNLLTSTAEGCSSLNVSKLTTAWSSLSTAFASLDATYSGATAFFKASDSDQNGTAVEKAAARYDYIVGKYLKVLGNESFEDFADRNPAAISGLGTNKAYNTSSMKSSLPLIITIVGVGVLAAGGLLVLQRRRSKED